MQDGSLQLANTVDGSAGLQLGGLLDVQSAGLGMYHFSYTDILRFFFYLKPNINSMHKSMEVSKGRLISKGHFGAFKSTKKPKKLLRISALAYKVLYFTINNYS